MYVKKISLLVAKMFVLILIFFVSAYPFINYVGITKKVGFLTLKSDEIFNSILWKTGFYLHIIFGALALFIGWTQFIKKWRNTYMSIHRFIGKIYIISVWLSCIGVFIISFSAEGGLIAFFGFFIGNIIWFYTTTKAYLVIKKKNILSHQKLITYSYAMCLGAVTLRVLLPNLVSITNNFLVSYQIVSWFSWIPNLIIAYYINKKIEFEEVKV